MNEWYEIIPQAIGGAIAAIIGAIAVIAAQRINRWLQRPKLIVDFEKFSDIDLNDYEAQAIGYHGGQAIYKVKYLRLVVKNKGKSPALNCEAKLVLKHASDTYTCPVHWAKRDPILYKRFENNRVIYEMDKIFAPIDISGNNCESLELIKFPYYYSIAPNSDHSSKRDTTFISLPPPIQNLMIFSDDDYDFEVTVYAHNTNTESFKFHCKWDGTIEGFNKAFTKT